MNDKGLIIVVEGTTCSGKTSVAKGLVQLVGSNVEYMKTLPSDRFRLHLAEKQKTCSEYELDILFLEDLYDSAKEAEVLASKGTNVIMDRYFSSLSSFWKKMRSPDAYQNLMDVVDLNELVRPDFTFLLSADPKVREIRFKFKTDVSKIDERLLNDADTERYMQEEAQKFNATEVDTSYLSISEVASVLYKRVFDGN